LKKSFNVFAGGTFLEKTFFPNHSPKTNIKHFYFTFLSERTSSLYLLYILHFFQSGDLCVFDVRSLVFRTSLPVVNNGLVAISLDGEDDNLVYVAGGDGKIKCLTGSDTVWSVKSEGVLGGKITAMALGAGELCVATTDPSRMWRVRASDLSKATLTISSHSSQIMGVSFPSEVPGKCVTVSKVKKKM
jgi:hypothetical protein